MRKFILFRVEDLAHLRGASAHVARAFEPSVVLLQGGLFLLSLVILMLIASGAYAATELVSPEPEWGAARETIAAKARGELYLEEDDWLWYTSDDAYDGCIVETQYRFNAGNELKQTTWSMRPQIDSNVDLAQMLTEYNRLKDALLQRYGAPECGNPVIVKRGETEDVTYPDAPPSPVVADIQSGVCYSFESRWCTDEVAIFLYVAVSDSGKASINASFHSEKYE